MKESNYWKEDKKRASRMETSEHVWEGRKDWGMDVKS